MRQGMPPAMRGVPMQPRQSTHEQIMLAQDEKIAQALQAQEYHRSLHPSRIAGGGGSGPPMGAGHGGMAAMIPGGRGAMAIMPGGHQAMMPGGPQAMMPGARDPEREARHKARDQQLEMALEVNPEAFVHVPMLYVQCLLNNVPIKAFVDTGAQMTVMTLQCAKMANLTNLIDSRFRGVAAGVGAARIVGRVHMAQLRFGKRMACDVSITVLEQSSSGAPDLLCARMPDAMRGCGWCDRSGPS